MKTLVNKNNPKIRITAPEIERRKAMFCQDEHYCLIIKGLPWLDADDWTLVEEEPKHTEVWVEGRAIFEQDAKKPEVDLEEVTEEYIEKRASLAPDKQWDIEDMRDAVRFGAEWQKQRDKEWMEAKEKECNDTRNDGFDAFMDGFNKGYELGIKEQTKK